MSPDLNLQELLETTPDKVELGQIVRELGYLLPKANLQELREFRAEVATIRDHPEMESPERSFVRGALFAMVEVCTSYEAEVQAQEDRQQRSAFAAEKPLHSALLNKIFEGLTRPTDLAEALGKDRAQISRALNELRSAGLLELVSPGPIGDQRQRLYRVTTEGLRILSAQGWQSAPGEPKTSEVLEFESDSSGRVDEAASTVAAADSQKLPLFATLASRSCVFAYGSSLGGSLASLRFKSPKAVLARPTMSIVYKLPMNRRLLWKDARKTREASATAS